MNAKKSLLPIRKKENGERKVSTFDARSNRKRLEIYVKMGGGGKIEIVYWFGISHDFCYFLKCSNLFNYHNIFMCLFFRFSFPLSLASSPKIYFSVFLKLLASYDGEVALAEENVSEGS